MKDISKIVSSYLDKVAKAVVADAKRNAPVKTGPLRDSIQSKREGDTIYVYSDIEYAKYIELGTRYMTPKPFLRTAGRNRRNYKG